MNPNLRPHIYFFLVIVVLSLIACGAAVYLRSKSSPSAMAGPSAMAAANLPPAQGIPLISLPPNAERTVVSPHEWRGACLSCHPLAQSAPAQMALAPWGGAQSPALSGIPGALPPQSNAQAPSIPQRPSNLAWRVENGFAAQQQGAGNTALQSFGQTGNPPLDGRGLQDILSPVQQKAADMALFEGHWLGMETMDLSGALRSIYKVPDNVQGVIIDEVTLESAESGLLAGDVIMGINTWRTGNLREFFKATVQVREDPKAEITVCRLGAVKRFTLTAKNAPMLGFAGMEGAAPIKPGSISPHKNAREACTACHVFMATGGQLPTDAGDILPAPPPITANARAPHSFKGVCNTCHQIIQ